MLPVLSKILLLFPTRVIGDPYKRRNPSLGARDEHPFGEILNNARHFA